MENNHHHQQHHTNSEADQRINGGSNKSSNNSFHCRQSSTRWIPTSDQIRILRDLYYVNGLRSPNAEQIQRISARLRQYGKIEGKNVFYWFQNHKARERQKKRLNVELPNTTTTTTATTTTATATTTNNKYSSGSSFGHPGVAATPCGSMSLRDNCIYGGGDGSMVENDGMGWAYAYNIGAAMETREMETLQLFPMHAQEEQEAEHEEQREDVNGMLSYSLAGKTSSFPGFYWGGSGVHQQQQEQSHNFIYDNHYSTGGSASLELTLNSYCYEGST